MLTAMILLYGMQRLFSTIIIPLTEHYIIALTTTSVLLPTVKWSILTRGVRTRYNTILGIKQAGAELCQAQLKLRLDFN